MTQPKTMPTTHFHIATLHTQNDADAVLFELQDLPCIHVADVQLLAHTAWAQHTHLISPEEIAAALEQAGYSATITETR